MVVPQRILSIVGTSAWTVTDPDDLEVPDEQVQATYREGAKLVPAVVAAPEWAVWAAAWPQLDATGTGTGGREPSRTFGCLNHAATDGVEGLVTITGGTATTLRAMAEATADLVCAELGVDASCRTREVVLEPHTAYWTGRAA
jgi:glycerol-3-phosphate dehydrogenase